MGTLFSNRLFGEGGGLSSFVSPYDSPHQYYDLCEECLEASTISEEPIFTWEPDKTGELKRTVEEQGARLAAQDLLLKELAVVVKTLQDQLSASKSSEQANVDPCLADVLELTESMFRGRPSVSLTRDPEIPEHPLVVVTVQACGDFGDLIKLRHEWHDRVAKLGPGSSGEFRLLLIPK